MWLTGCAYTSVPLSDVVLAIAAESWGDDPDAAFLASQHNTAYRYLRVQVQDRAPALLVLGYVDPHPQGDIEVWYSAQREVIKLQHGRIVSTLGLPTDWRAVRYPYAPPAWTKVSPQGDSYPRLRDTMPGYHYAVTDQMTLTPWRDAPPLTLPASVPNELARSYDWFQETMLSSSTTGEPLPPSWYAWGIHRGQATVVYSEQCLSATFCLTLQRWPVQEKAS